MDEAEGPFWLKKTSASSGPALSVVYSTPFYLDELYFAIPRVLSSIGVHEFGDRLAVNLSDSAHRVGSIYLCPDPRIGLQIDLPMDFRRASDRATLIAFLSEFRPKVLACRAEILDLLMITHASSDLRGIVEFIICSGSFLNNRRRQAIERYFCARTIDVYASTEFGLVAWQRDLEGGLVVDASRFEVECDAGGELLITGSENSALPLLRYRTGDIGALRQHDTDQRIVLDERREIPIFLTAAGDPFLPTYYHAELSAKRIWDYSIHQPRLGEIEVHAAADVDFQVLQAAIEDAERNIPVPTLKTYQAGGVDQKGPRFSSKVIAN